jgi:(p)ppGpp synthase/HD superfamily hydrolase
MHNLDSTASILGENWTLPRIEALATTAHLGQTDQAGQAYIEHPRRVAEAVTQRGGSELEIAAAWLHDVAEDTELTLDVLEALGLSNELVAAVDALTMRHGETRDEYYTRVQANPTALAVKLDDINDNADPDRLDRLDETTRARLEAKYAKARARLTS